MLLVMSIATPHAFAGSATDPHIEDGCESEATDSTVPDILDISKAWVGPFLDKEVIIQLCGDLKRGEQNPLMGGHEEAAAGRFGWEFRWNDTFGAQWRVKAWSTFGNWFQCVTRDGRMVGKTEWPQKTGYPDADFEKNRLVLHFPPEGTVLDMLVRKDLHAVGVMHNSTPNVNPDPKYDESVKNWVEAVQNDPTDPPFPPLPASVALNYVSECDTIYDPIDRAPDTGFGRDVNLTIPNPEPPSIPLEVELVAERPSARVRPGESAEIPFAALKDEPVHRQMHLTVDAPEAWSPNLDVSWIDPSNGQLKTVDFGTKAPLVLRPFTDRNRTVLTIDVPKSTPPGTYPIEIGGAVHNETQFFAGEVSARAEVTVPPFDMAIKGHETRYLVKPNGSIVNELEITNEGEMSDTYDLTLSGEPAEWASLETRTVALDPGQTATVDLTVEVAPNASNDIYSHTVEAVSRTLPWINDRTTTTTQVLDEILADPLGAAMNGRPTPTVVGLYALAIGGLAVIGAAAGKP